MILEKNKRTNYDLYYTYTNKFNSRRLSVKFITESSVKNITTFNFLSNMLTESTKKHNTNKKLNIKLTNLYGCTLNSAIETENNKLTLQVSMTVLNDEIVDEIIFKNAIQVFFEAIYNPNIEDGKFDKKAFDFVKQIILTKLETEKENPRQYAMKKILEEIEQDDKYSITSNGTIKELNKITRENLVSVYNNMITNAKVEATFIGNIEKEKIIKILDENLKLSNNNTYKEENNNILPVKQKISTVKITGDVKQGVLMFGLRAANCSDYEKDFILPYYSFVLGGGPSSKLFVNVREKNSLAYYAFSWKIRSRNLVLISSGIDKSKYEKAKEVIKDQISFMKNNITDDEFKIANKNIVNNYRKYEDFPGQYIETQHHINSLGYKYNEFIKSLDEVTIEDIYKFAEKIIIDTILLYHGGSNE